MGRPKSTRTCRVLGCDGKHRSSGFCQRHYRWFKYDREKDPSLTPETWDPDNRSFRKRGRKPNIVPCRVEDCGEKHYAKGFCRWHSNQFSYDRRKNPSLTPETWDPDNRSFRKRGRKPNIVPCRVEDCNGKHRGLGFCSSHYQQFAYDRRLNPDLTPDTWDPDNRPGR